MQLFSLLLLLLTTSFDRKRPYKRNNDIICRGIEQHTDRGNNDVIQRSYEQNQQANNQAATVENPITGIRTKLFWTSKRRPYQRCKNYTILRNFKIKIELRNE
jgi:hypothetical protein